MKRKSINSCFICEKDGVTCDEKHPCGRCASLGKAHMCLPINPDLILKKTNNSASTNLSNTIKTEHKDGRRTNENDHLIPSIVAELKDLKEEMKVLRQQYDKLISILLGPQSEGTTPYDMPPQNTDFNDINVTSSGVTIAAAPTSQSAPLSNITVGGVRTIKPFSTDLTVDISKLGPQNYGTYSLSSGTDPLAQPYSVLEQDSANDLQTNLQNSANSQQPWVVFDLLKQPPIVVKVSESFCTLLGYKTNEIIGMSWMSLIDPKQIEPTKKIFIQRNFGDKIEFCQIYKHRNGAIFPTVDTHKIIFNADGLAINDVVTVSLRNPAMWFPTPSPGSTSNVHNNNNNNNNNNGSNLTLSLYSSPQALIYPPDQPLTNSNTPLISYLYGDPPPLPIAQEDFATSSSDFPIVSTLPNTPVSPNITPVSTPLTNDNKMLTSSDPNNITWASPSVVTSDWENNPAFDDLFSLLNDPNIPLS